MSNNGNDELESTTEPTEEVAKTEEVEEVAVADEGETEDIETLKEKLAKTEEANKKLFERTKKAEAEAKALKGKTEPKPEAKPEPFQKQDGLTPMDTLALFNAKVTIKEDIETVQKYARNEGISIEKALGDEVVQNILKTRTEQRASAEASNTGNARRGSTKPTDQQILNDAAKDKLPEDPTDLAEARWESKRKK